MFLKKWIRPNVLKKNSTLHGLLGQNLKQLIYRHKGKI